MIDDGGVDVAAVMAVLDGLVADLIDGSVGAGPQQRPVIPCRRTFKKYGESGIPVSEWFPNVGSVIDDIAVVRSSLPCRD